MIFSWLVASYSRIFVTQVLCCTSNHPQLSLMNTRILKFAAALTAGAMMASCANIQNDQTRTRTEGALAGGVLGAGLGAIIGNQSGNAWEGAAIGAVAGSLAGLAVGDHVARKKAAYASQEAWLDACISRAEQVNANAVSYNNRLSRRIDSLRQQIAAAKASGNKSKLQGLKREVATLRSETRTQVKVVETEITEQTDVVSETGSSSLRGRVTTLKSTRTSLQSNERRLADLGNQIDV